MPDEIVGKAAHGRIHRVGEPPTRLRFSAWPSPKISMAPMAASLRHPYAARSPFREQRPMPHADKSFKPPVQTTHRRSSSSSRARPTPLQDSPRLTAQRQQLRTLFGDIAQLDTGSGPAERPRSVTRPDAAGVVQREWLPGSKEGESRWSRLRGGLQWIHRDDGLMTFEIPDTSLVNEKFIGMHGHLSGTWLPHTVWMDKKVSGVEWWPEPAGPKKGEEKKDDGIDPFTKTESDGRAKFQSILGNARGAVDPQTQAARDNFFSTYYETPDVKAGYADSTYRYPSGNSDYKGKYQNTFKGPQINAVYNYAESEGRETYYDPVKKQLARMSNSEIIYQQFKKLGVDAEPIGSLLRSRVSGDGLPILHAVRKRLGVKAVVLRPGDPGFHTLLTTPNCTAALWLVADHGIELGLLGIDSISITDNASIEVTFRRA
jgi:hypothetical protein